MTPSRWKLISKLVASALEIPALERPAFVERNCGGDNELCQEVESLLSNDVTAESFLRKPATFDDTTDDGALASDSTSRFHGTSRFEIRRVLGSGGFGTVYEALDMESNAVVALKCLRGDEPELLYRLKNEFRALADIRHRNLVELYELICDGGHWFFTMELLDGADIVRSLRRSMSATSGASNHFELLRETFSQLADGVNFLHERGLIHRDIKPSNILTTSEGRVVLLDFGLVKNTFADGGGLTQTLAFTPAYVAPELCAGKPRTEASDWYGVGAVLFECLTGTPPFVGSAMEILLRKPAEAAPRPSSRASGIPRLLDDLCYSLLSPNPLCRPTGVEIQSALGGAPPYRSLRAQPMPAHSIGGDLLFRESELSELREAFDLSERGFVSVVLLEGPSGVGKTSLVRSFLMNLMGDRKDAVVVRGSCYESETVPFKALDELVDNLSRRLRAFGKEEMESFFPLELSSLSRIFPVMKKVHEGAGIRRPPRIADAIEQKRCAFSALRECFARIAERYPLVIWIDDLQWGDQDSAQFFNDFAIDEDAPGCMIILSQRDGGALPAASALQWQNANFRRSSRFQSRELTLVNLNPRQSITLARHLIGDRGSATPEVFHRIASDSEGNPFVIKELAAFVIKGGISGQSGVGASPVENLILQRVAELPQSAFRLLRTLAVAGQPLDASIAQRAIGLGPGFKQARVALTSARLARSRDAAGRTHLEVTHDQVRRAVLLAISETERANLHEGLGVALEELGNPREDSERLAQHFELAGSVEKAARYSEQAAATAFEALAFDRAAQLYGKTLSLADPPLPTRRALLRRLASSLSNAGRGRESAEVFIEASELCEGEESLERLMLRRLACEQYLRSGHFEVGMDLARSLLREAGVWFPRRPWQVVLSLVWLSARLRLNNYRSRERSVEMISQRELAKLDVCWTAALGTSMMDSLWGAESHARYLLLALQTGEPYRLALGLAAEVPMCAIRGVKAEKQVRKVSRLATRLVKRIDRPHATAFAMSMRGIAAWLMCDWSGCLESHERASEIYTESCTGVNWELTTAHGFVLSSLVFLGRWAESRRRLPQLAQRARARGDLYGASSLPLLGYYYAGLLALDNPARARAEIDSELAAWPKEPFLLQHCDAGFGLVEIALYEGEINQAWRQANELWKSLKRSNLLAIQFNRIQILVLRGRAALRSMAGAATSKERKSFESITKAHIAALRDQGIHWAEASANLLSAGRAATNGEKMRAIDLLYDAETGFENAQMEHCTAIVRLRLAQLLAGDKGREKRAQADRWITRETVSNPQRLADTIAPGLWANAGAASLAEPET